MEQLADDANHYVRLAIAQRSDLSDNIIKLLENDENIHVREVILAPKSK